MVALYWVIYIYSFRTWALQKKFDPIAIWSTEIRLIICKATNNEKLERQHILTSTIYFADVAKQNISSPMDKSHNPNT